MNYTAFFSLGILQKVKLILASFTNWLVGFGVFGIGILMFLDGAALPLAGAPDVALATLSLAKPANWWLYAVVAAVGSTLGCWVLYSTVRRAGRKVIDAIKPERRRKIESLFLRYDLLTLVGASLLPPPFPFKPFIICAAMVRFSTPRFIIGLLIGRGIRYGVLAFLAKTYGDRAMEIIKQNSLWFFIGLAVVGVGFFLLQKAVATREAEDDEALSASGSAQPNM